MPLVLVYSRYHINHSSIDAKMSMPDSLRVQEIRKRFENDFLPKYGALWRNMIKTQQVTVSPTPPGSVLNFVDAIERKQAVTLAAPTHYVGCECGCVAPIQEWKDSSEITLDEEELPEYVEDGPDISCGDEGSDDSTIRTPLPEHNMTSFFRDDEVGSMDHGQETPMREQKETVVSQDLVPRVISSDEICSEERSFGGDEDDQNDLQSSSGSTVVKFDISHIVQSTPEKEDTPRRSASDSPQKCQMQENIFSPESSPQFSPRVQENKLSHLDVEDEQTSSIDSQSFGSSVHHFDLSQIVHASPQREGQETFGTPSNFHFTKGKAHQSDHEESHYNEQIQRDKSKVNISTLNGSVLIDLVDSDSDDDDDEEESARKEDSTLKEDILIVPSPEKIKTRSGRQVNKYFQQRRTEYWQASEESSGDENEWSEDSSGDCSFESPSESEASDELTDLINRTNKIEIIDDDSNMNLENHNPNRPERCQGARSKRTMSKAAFKKNRESLAKGIFDEFDNKAFQGKLSSVNIVWSTKLRTTAGLTRLKRCNRNMKPGVPQNRLASIELSTKVLDDEERLRSTLLHEMVHAAAWIIDGVSKPPHGPCFKKWANVAMRKISGVVVTTTHDYEIQYKYAWVSSPATKIQICLLTPLTVLLPYFKGLHFFWM